MTLWEFAACIAGWSKANSIDDDEPPQMTSAELDELNRRSAAEIEKMRYA